LKKPFETPYKRGPRDNIHPEETGKTAKKQREEKTALSKRGGPPLNIHGGGFFFPKRGCPTDNWG